MGWSYLVGWRIKVITLYFFKNVETEHKICINNLIKKLEKNSPIFQICTQSFSKQDCVSDVRTDTPIY